MFYYSVVSKCSLVLFNHREQEGKRCPDSTGRNVRPDTPVSFCYLSTNQGGTHSSEGAFKGRKRVAFE